jgi:hypothetical protein
MAIPNFNYYQYRPVSEDIPVDTYKDVMEKVASRYDKALDDRDMIYKAVSTIRTNADGQTYLKSITDKINSNFANLTTSISGQKRWDLANNQIRDTVNMIAGDKNIQAMVLSQKNIDKADETKQRLMVDGPVIDMAGGFDNHKWLNSDGTVNVYNPLYQKKADGEKTVSNIAKDITGEIETNIQQIKSVEGLNMLQASTTLAVTESTIKKNFDRYKSQYLASGEGDQRVKELTMANRGLTPDKLRKLIDDDINGIVDRGIRVAADAVFKKTAYAPFENPNDVYDRSIAKQQAGIDARKDASIEVNAEKLKAKALADKIKDHRNGKVTEDTTLFPLRNGLHYTGDVNKTVYSAIDRTANAYGLPPILQDRLARAALPSVADVKLKDGKSLPSDAVIIKFVPNSITRVNEDDSKYDGSLIGSITYSVGGKLQTPIDAYVVNGTTEVQRGFNLPSEAAKAVATTKGEVEEFKIPAGKSKVKIIEDTNNLVGTVQKRLSFKVESNRNGNGIDTRITPMFVVPKESLGLKPNTETKTVTKSSSIGITQYGTSSSFTTKEEQVIKKTGFVTIDNSVYYYDSKTDQYYKRIQDLDNEDRKKLGFENIKTVYTVDDFANMAQTNMIRSYEPLSRLPKAQNELINQEGQQ